MTDAPDKSRPDALVLSAEERAALAALVRIGAARSVATLARVHPYTVKRAADGGAMRPDVASKLRAFLAGR